jgi:outer membrane receptor protein involved in Fe transport
MNRIPESGSPVRLRPFLCTSIAFICCVLVHGQAQTGEIRVQVNDSSGAAMQASGKIANPTTGVVQSFQTDAQGLYTVGKLPPGTYRLQISRNGFATQSVSVDVASGASVSQAVTLPVSAVASKVDVVGTTPLSGVGLAVDEIPAPVQTGLDLDITNSGAIDLADFINRRLDGVFVNEIQGNPFQPDVSYRGYTASPLLGTPQGLSVYMDGVRLNQPFGDVVAWDLIPKVAISEITLMPGSNPVFGLNTLGGALSIQTKDGRNNPGTSVQVVYGSYDRKALEFEHGGAFKGFNWYLAGNGLTEHGWRASSPSDVHQLFGKFGWQNSKTVLGLTVAYANNSLIGNGLQDQRLLASDYGSVYTIPDRTVNRSPFLNFNARHAFNDKLMFSGNVYYRYILTNSLNGDINEDSLDQSIYQPSAAEQAALRAAGYTGFPTSGATAANTPFPFWRCIGNVLLRDEPGEKCNGLLNRTRTNQHNYGVSGQMTWLGSPGGRHNQFTVGAGWDASRVDFVQSTQLGYLNPDRTITPLNAFADGVTGGNVDGVPYDNRVNLNGRPNTGSVYATDTLSIGNKLNLTLSGRYNRTTIDNKDNLQPQAGPGSLSSHNVFDRFNPAAGLTYKVSPLFDTYFGYNQGSRAPTSIELGCADPNQPCKLPNALAGDPPLKQVVTHTLEAGFRGSLEQHVNWSVGWFRGVNHDDLLFVASTQTGFGYFKNFGETRRQGLEVDLDTRFHRLNIGGGYTFLDATYQSPETVDGTGNSTNDAGKGLEGTIQIQPGARIPLIPQHMLKAYLDLQATSKLLVDFGLVAVSSSFARGNENNLDKPDDVFYLGPGQSPGYAVLNLGAHYQVHRRLQVFIQLSNLADRRYYTGAQLGPTGLLANGNFIARQFPAVNGDFPVQQMTFFAPGAPRTAWGGIRFSF